MDKNENKGNVVELGTHCKEGAGLSVEKTDGVTHTKSNATNPIVKNFVKFFVYPKGKFSIKDILR